MYSARERTPDAEGAFQALRKHDEYYLPGGDLFFLIEQNHFRVHRYFFERESPFFKAKLATPASPGASRQGTSESTAIVLNDVKAADFAKFLWVFYNPKYSLYYAPVEDWVSILHLAHKWGFTEIQALVVREIEKLYMTDIRRVVVYHRYDIDRRLLLANYAALVAREHPLTLEEGMELGMETTLKIFRAREIARSTPDAGGIRSPRPVTLPHKEMRGLVRDLFEITALEDGEGDGDDMMHTPVEEAKPAPPEPVQAQNQTTKKPPVNTNGVNGTTKPNANATANGNANGNAANGNVNGNAPNGNAAGKDTASPVTANGNANATANGNANNAVKNGTTDSTTPKTGAGAGAANADPKATANGTLNGVKDSTTTTTGTTATSNATTTTPSTTTSSTTNSGAGDPIFARMNQKIDTSNTGNGTADATKKDGQAGDKNSTDAANKDKETKDEPSTPIGGRPETPTGGAKVKNPQQKGKKGSWAGF